MKQNNSLNSEKYLNKTNNYEAEQQREVPVIKQIIMKQNNSEKYL
jgi:hypothetical protein